MPHIVVYNLSKSDFEEKRIEDIEKALTEAVVDISELQLTPDDVSFSFPQDPTVTSDEIPVIIIVELLFEKPRRTLEVRRLLAQRIVKYFSAVVIAWRRLIKVGVAVKRFDPEKDGFYSERVSLQSP